MSTESKPKTPATTTTVSPDTSSEKATTQLKEQFSNLFGFFTKVSTDVTSSSTTNTNPITQKGFTGFLEALNKKAKEFRPSNSEKADKSTDKEKTSKEKGDKSHREKNESEVKPTEKENHNKEEGDKSNREKTPQQPPKEVQAQLPPKVESKKPGSAKAKPAEPPVAKYNSLQDLFGSLSNFVSHAATSIQTGSSNVYNKLEAGIDINARVKRGFRPTLIKQELREDKKIAVDNATKKRLEEAKKMKENFEKQLKNLDQEIVQLERGEEPNAEDGSNRSNQGKQPKKFRISSQKSFREGSDKSVGSGNEAKPLKKVLAPLEDGKHGGKKWHEGQKGIKNASSQPLYLRMEKEFQQNVVFPELEARKEKLKLKREFYKPMDDKELREHALKYEERKKTLAHGEKENDKLAPLHFAKSNAYKKVLEQEKEDKVKTEQKVEERKQLKDKAQQYAKLVKEMFFPKPDPKDDLLSKENLQEIIARSQKAELPVLTKESSNTTYTSGPKMHLRKKRPSHDITQNTAPQNVETQQSPERTYVPHNYLKKRVGVKVNVSPPVEHVLKEHKDAMILPSEGFDDEQTEVKPVPIKKKYEAKPRMVSMSPKRNEKKLLEKGEDEVKNEVVEPEFAKKAYPNYLTEVRNKRIEQEKKTGKGKYGQWEKFLKNKEMSQQEKVINILDDINRLEAQAKKKESKLKRFDPNREHEPLELEDEVGEMYLESIKAKLAIIKDLA